MTFPEMIHGKKPEVAPFIPTDPVEMLQQLMSGEIKDWPQIEQLSNLYQTYMMGALDKAIPGFGDIMKTGGEDTQAMLDQSKSLIEGDIPKDVSDAVMRSSAFTSLGAGTMGGPMGSALAARNLGLTSLDLMKQGTSMAEAGTNAAQRWQSVAQGTILDPSKQLYSPQWFSQFMAEQNAARQATKQLRYNVAAQPDPVVSGISGTIMNLVGAYLGHGMGGGGNMLATSDPNKMAPANYVGGAVSTPSGANYGQGTPGFQVGQPGYYNEIGMQDPNSIPSGTSVSASGDWASNPIINTNPTGSNFSMVPSFYSPGGSAELQPQGGGVNVASNQPVSFNAINPNIWDQIY